MSLVRLAAVAALGAALAAPLGAQVPRRPREQQVAGAAALLVANPYVSSSADSAAAVQVGTGMRERMTKNTDGDYNVLTQDQMNEALKQYGYPGQRHSEPAFASTLAKSVQARVLVSSSMTKAAAQLRRPGPAGGRQRRGRQRGDVPQGSGRGSTTWGPKSPISCSRPTSPWPTRRVASISGRPSPTRPPKPPTRRSSNTPATAWPNSAWRQIAMAKKDAKEAIKHFQAAAKADPLSIDVWANLAELYQAQNDTANVLATFAELLRVAPTNQKLREQAFQYFLNAEQAGHRQGHRRLRHQDRSLQPGLLRSEEQRVPLPRATSSARLMHWRPATRSIRPRPTRCSSPRSRSRHSRSRTRLDTAQVGPVSESEVSQQLTLLQALAKAYSLPGPSTAPSP